MSEATERHRHSLTLAAYSLVSLRVAAAFLDVKVETIKLMISEGELPAIPVRKRFKIDPLDLAVLVLASKGGITPPEFWARHGDDTAAHARLYIDHIRKFQGK